VAAVGVLAVVFRDQTKPCPTQPKRKVVVQPQVLTQPTLDDTVADPVTPVNFSFQGRQKTRIDELVEKYDPTADDWDTEVLNDVAKKKLSRVSDLIRNWKESEADPKKTIHALLTEDFSCSSLGGLSKSTLNDVFDDGTLHVWRLGDSVALPTPGEIGSRDASRQLHHGPAGLSKALRQLIRGLGQGPNLRAKLKVFQIHKLPDGFITRVLVEASNRSVQMGVQQNATWQCHWTYPETGQEPRLLRINLESYEYVENQVEGGTLFTDCTASVLGATPAYTEQLLRGIDHWLPRLGRYTGATLLGHHGLAVGDVNGDGLDDVYLCEPGGLPNRLFVQNSDGTTVDFSSNAGVDWLEESKSALLIDLDNDGDQDLVVAMPGRIVFAENQGQAHFKLKFSNYAVSDPTSLCAADYDGDSDVDVFVCAYIGGKERGGLPMPVPFHDANNGGKNILMRNEGGFRFIDATDPSGLGNDNSRFSFAAAWDDYDNDGDIDLYVANDFGRNNLYRNDGGRFVDVAAGAGVEDIATGMSVSWGDYNRDGLMDVYVGNMYSSAGNRVTYQRRLSEKQSDKVVAHVQRMARGNTLFANAGNNTFQDVSEAAAVTMGRWAWASKFVDLNNDGWQDLVVTNGYVTNAGNGDL